MLINEQILKAQIGGIQKKLNFDTWLPSVKMADREFREEAGGALYDYLHDGDWTADSDAAELKDLAEGCIAWAAYDKVLPHLKFAVGDVGIVKNSPQTTQAVAKWEYTDTREEILKTIDSLYESFFRRLDEVKPDAWTASPAYQIRNGLFIRSADDLNEYISLAGKNRRFFARIAEFIRRAEDFYIRPAVTDEVFTSLKAAFRNPAAAPTANEKALIEKIRPALAYLAVYEAFKYIPLSVEVSSLRTLRSAEPSRYEETNENERRQGIRQELYQDGQLYLADLKKYLDRTATATVFSGYYDAYLAPTSDQTNYEDYTGKSHVIL
jgi:hypothetical protein